MIKIESYLQVASMGAFWLGAKLEEVIEIDAKDKLRIRDVLTVFYRLIRRREGRTLDILDPHSKVYAEQALHCLDISC